MTTLKDKFKRTAHQIKRESMYQEEEGLTTPLLGFDNTKKTAPASQPIAPSDLRIWLFSTTGNYITKAAMIGQGMFAALLTAKAVRNMGPARIPLTIAGGIVVGYASYFGKYTLVWFYGQERWCRDYPSQSIQELLNQLNPKTWKLNDDENTLIPSPINYSLGFLIRVASLVMSYIFWGLTIVSLGENSGAAYLARDLGWNWGADNIFSSPLLNLTLSLAAFISNITSWSIILQLGYLNLKTILNDLGKVFISPLSQEQEQLRAVFHYFIYLVNNQDKLKLEAEIQQITTCFDPCQISTHSNLLNYYNQKNEAVAKHQSPRTYPHQRLFHWLAAMAVVTMNVYGFLNFKDMPQIIQGDLPSYLHMPEIALTILGYITYTSMLLLGTSVYQPSKELTATLTGHTEPTIYYYGETAKQVSNYWCILLGFFGAGPNLYQSIIDGQEALVAATAIGSSFAVELPTLLSIYDQEAEEKALKSRPELQRIKTTVGLFRAVLETPIEKMQRTEFNEEFSKEVKTLSMI